MKTEKIHSESSGMELSNCRKYIMHLHIVSFPETGEKKRRKKVPEEKDH